MDLLSARGSNGERVITIGAMGAHNDTDLYKTGAAVSTSKWSGIEKTDYKAEFSNFGPGVVVWAPGCAHGEEIKRYTLMQLCVQILEQMR